MQTYFMNLRCQTEIPSYAFNETTFQFNLPVLWEVSLGSIFQSHPECTLPMEHKIQIFLAWAIRSQRKSDMDYTLYFTKHQR